MTSKRSPNDENYYQFARIIPEGSDAERALDQVYNDTKLSEYHNDYIHVERRTKKSESSSENSGSDRRPSPESQYWAGYYALSLQNLPRKPTSIGWRIGRGSSRLEGDRGVDILLICPKAQSQGVAPVHARIQFHPRSGVLMLVGVVDDKPVRYEVGDSAEPVLLRAGEKRVLYQMRNRIVLGNLHYTLVFESQTAQQYSEYVTVRDGMFQDLTLSPPHHKLSALPRLQDMLRGPVVTHGTMSTGAFGWIYSAVDARSGEPLAVKEQRPKNKKQLDEIVTELSIGKLFSQKDGLLRTVHVWCEHQNHGVCGQVPDVTYVAFPLALGDFGDNQWGDYSLRQVIEFYQGPLQGLQTLHSAGYMHRDVHNRNLLIVSLNPPQGVLSDYGKAIQASSHCDPHLGPPWTCAPEVDGKSRYDNRIDIWSIAFSMCYALFPRYQNQTVDRGKRITKDWHKGITAHVLEYSNRGEDQAAVADLLGKMLAWDPKDRITARSALQHSCMRKDEASSEQSCTGYRDPAVWNEGLASPQSASNTSTSFGAGADWLAFHNKRRKSSDKNTNALIQEYK